MSMNAEPAEPLPLLSLALQAGGKSKRMGRDKALMPFLGQPLIRRVLERLAPLSSDVYITTNHPENYGFLALRLVPEILPNLGAQGGLYTALVAARCPFVAVVACDMPFASLKILAMAARLMEQEGADVVIPRTATGLEPMHAVYRRDACLPVVRTAIESGQLKIIDWFSLVRVRQLSISELQQVDSGEHTFFNLNTAEEFALAERLAGADGQI
jgi:molybdopterin-guanine dinucleotide biosynthesis protein A